MVTLKLLAFMLELWIICLSCLQVVHLKERLTSSVKGFRLDSEILNDLTKDSKLKGISLSNHVSHILVNYNGSYRHLERLHFMWFSREMTRELIKNIDDKGLEKIGEMYAKDLKKQIRYSHGEVKPKITIETIEKNCLIQDMPFTEKDLPDGSIRYTIFHELGKNWSNITKMMLEKLMKNGKTQVMDFDSNGEYISFTVQN